MIVLLIIVFVIWAVASNYDPERLDQFVAEMKRRDKHLDTQTSTGGTK